MMKLPMRLVRPTILKKNKLFPNKIDLVHRFKLKKWSTLIQVSGKIFCNVSRQQ